MNRLGALPLAAMLCAAAVAQQPSTVQRDLRDIYRELVEINTTDSSGVAREDREGRIRLAGYMIRVPMSLEKMTYDAATGTVIPDRHEHLVRYVGWYSNRARGERAKALKAQQPAKTPPTRGAQSLKLNLPLAQAL